MTFLCEVCDQERDIHPVARLIDNYVVLRCGNCSVKNIYPIPDDHELKEYYSGYYLTRDDFAKEEKLIGHHGPIYEYLTSKVGKDEPISFLDFGFGAGHFIKLLSRKNVIVSGFDLSEQNRQQIREYNDRNGTDIGLPDIFSSRGGNEEVRFDVITMFQVLEHLNKPRETLEHLASCLNEGGYIYLECPNNDALINNVKNIINKLLRRKKYYDSLKPPEHIFGYNRKSMSILFESLGFEIIDLDDYFLADGVHQVEGIYWWPPLTRNRQIYHPLWLAKSLMQFTDRALSKFFKGGSGLYMLARKK